MSSWGIAEWYGQDIRTMTSDQRKEAAAVSVSLRDKTLGHEDAPACPFLQTIKPGAVCNKLGGVCSIREYEDGVPVILTDAQPASVCPNRFLETDSGQSVFAYIAEKLYKTLAGAKVVKEIPFLHKIDADGQVRSAKAGRIDWVVLPTPPGKGDSSRLDWVAVETQAVYFSGGNMWDDIEKYLDHPERLHYPHGHRRPDYRLFAVEGVVGGASVPG